MARRVMIVGCGRLGAMVARALVARGDEVTIIDLDSDNFRRLDEGPGLNMVVADGTSDEDLRRTGIEAANAFICLTGQDTVNAMAAQTAQVTYRVPKVVCRINDPIRRGMYEELGLHTVSPPQVMTDLVLQAIER